jgi:hypothetical protein
MSTMFKQIKVETVLLIKVRLGVLLKRHYNDSIAEWLSTNCDKLLDQ